MAKIYDPRDWYWQVGEDETHFWSSHETRYVPVDDANLIEWREAGGLVTRIDTEANLAAVLADHHPAGWPGTLERVQALAGLDRSDKVALRCLKAGVEFPAEWAKYVQQLRRVVAGADINVPDQPAYPKGT